MKINIYYGGRGLVEDPTLFAVNKMMEVLKELRVEVERYNLYEEKSNISMLPQTLKNVDGVILATTVEWMGIGGFMQQFLDSCWFFGDKEKIENVYMLPVVLSTTYGERDGEHALIKSWELLGGKVVNGLCAYVADHVEFETNSDYVLQIEKRAEDLYRAVNQKAKVFPNSHVEMKQKVHRSLSLELTPQENEQLSMYASDDAYIKKQKEDIQELTQLFKEMLGQTPSTAEEFVSAFKSVYCPMEELATSYAITMQDKDKTLVLEVKGDQLACYYGEKEDAEVQAKTTHEVLNKIVKGETTFQKAFMTGEVTAKGNFKTLRSFDTLFPF